MPVDRPQPISREDIAEIHDARAEWYYDQAKIDTLMNGGPSMIDLIRKSVDCEWQAQGYRDIDKMNGNTRSVESHVYYTMQAWEENRRKKLKKMNEAHKLKVIQ